MLFMLRQCPPLKNMPWLSLSGLLFGTWMYVPCCTDHNAAGDISSVVSHIGDTYRWPDRFAELKRDIQPNAELLRNAWTRLHVALDFELVEIRQRQQHVVPVVQFSELQKHGGHFPPEVAASIRKRGVVVVRNVVDGGTARAWKQQVEAYAFKNPSHVGFPRDTPQVLELYWSRPQLHARQHPHMHATMLALNQLYKSSTSRDQRVSWDHVFTYGERLRVRQPGDESFVLQPHTDGGSIERWEDPNYRVAYSKILQGRWEEYDPWQGGDERAVVNMTMHSSAVRNGLATVFRAFQGWLAISAIGPVPEAGTLRVLPLLREATAHLVLRPFLADVAAADFCGAVPGMAHDVTEKWHARILQGMVTIPDMQPGDTVWWHPDVVHAVEGRHSGKEDSSVFYIPSLPLTLSNAEYVRRQRELFQEGRTPPDFPPNDSEVNFTDRGTEADLTALGRRLLGFEALSSRPGLEESGRTGDSCDATGAICAGNEKASPAEDLVAHCNAVLGFGDRKL